MDVLPPSEAEVASHSLQPPNGCDLERWVEAQIFTQSPAKVKRRVYLLPRTMAKDGKEERERPRARKQLLLWAEMAGGKRVRAVVADGGLGLIAERGLTVDMELARAQFDEKTTLEATGVTMKVGKRKGAVLGPPSLANCACAER